jgi:hypothetical protein
LSNQAFASFLGGPTPAGTTYLTGGLPAAGREIEAAQTRFSNNARGLARMMEHWQRQNNAPLKSFQLERMSIEFLSSWPHSQRRFYYHDWMVRDFLAHVCSRSGGSIIMPGTSEVVSLGDEWTSKSLTALSNAIKACSAERLSENTAAGEAWYEIFGPPWKSPSYK